MRQASRMMLLRQYALQMVTKISAAYDKIGNMRLVTEAGRCPACEAAVPGGWG